VYVEPAGIRKDNEIGQEVEHILSELRAKAQGGDPSFAEFLDASSYPDQVKQRAAFYVEGFNAARKEKIGIAALAQDAQASERINGDHLFSIGNGYDSLVRAMLQPIGSSPEILRLNTVVERVAWKPGGAALDVRYGHEGQRQVVRCRDAPGRPRFERCSRL
jgi:hypothetical protein